MTKAQFYWSLIYWLGIWFTGGFVIPELLGLYRIAPWVTLSEFVWADEYRWHPAKIIIFLLMIIVGYHFATQWPYDR